MLILIACLIGQFVPEDDGIVSIDAYLEACKAAKAAKRDFMHKLIDNESPDVLPRTLAEKKKKAAEDKKRHQKIEETFSDPSVLVHPQINLRNLDIGDAGEVAQGVNVLSVSENLIYCSTLDAEERFVVRKVNTSNVVDGKKLQLPGIFVVSGRYKFAGRTVYCLEPWDKAEAFTKRFEELAAEQKAENEKAAELKKKPSPKMKPKPATAKP